MVERIRRNLISKYHLSRINFMDLFPTMKSPIGISIREKLKDDPRHPIPEADNTPQSYGQTPPRGKRYSFLPRLP